MYSTRARARAGVVLLALLGGCQATVQVPPPATSSGPAAPVVTTSHDPVAMLKAFTITDLEAAQADATSHADTIAATCYAELVTTVQNLPSAGLPKPKGAFSAFQEARDVANGVKRLQGGLPQSLNVACAPLVLDASQTVLMLGARVGVAAAVPIALPGLIP